MFFVLHFLFFLLLAPLVPGLINKVKAACAGRNGPPVLQLYFDLFKLAQKEMVLSATTSWVFLAGPVVGLFTTLFAVCLMPIGPNPAPLSFVGDCILFAYLFALGRFFTTIAALDTGSAFEGMGAAREVTFAALAEPILFCAFIVLSVLSSSLSLSTMLPGMITSGPEPAIAVLIACALLVVLLVENCRIPFDDPNTHLELTMIHEVMILDHSGRAYGMILYGASLKLMLLSQLLVNMLFPVNHPFGFGGLLSSGIGILGIAVLIGLIESTMARLRMPDVPKLLVGAFAVASFGVVLVLR